MKYRLAGLFYWLIWFSMWYFGYQKLGIIVGIAIVFSLWILMWKLEFNTWKLGKYN